MSNLFSNISDVIERLQACSKLQTLILRGNCIRCVENLMSCPQLWNIDLSNNQVHIN